MPSSSSPTANADDAEVRKFSELAHRWWDATSEFKPLHEINPLRLAWINERTPLAGQRVLDVGCGGGILAESMARSGALVHGIDLSEAALGVAQLHGLESGVSVRYERVAAEELAARAAGAFDVVTCMELLEHVPRPAETVAACAKLVRPGGHVYFSTINRNPKAYLFAVLGAEYVLRLLPRGTHDYAKFVTPAELARFARGASLAVGELCGLHYNPITQRYWLAAGCDVNYMMACVRGE
jgi:2-polyprenyl-6-hydroxyphenyl methylase/3-demethylubiquinone-9 3-methyltransferase